MLVEVKYDIQYPAQGDLSVLIPSLTQSFSTCFTKKFSFREIKAYKRVEEVLLMSPAL